MTQTPGGGEYSLGTAVLRLTGDRSSLDRELELLRRYTENLERQGIKVKFDADTGQAVREVNGLHNRLAGMNRMLQDMQQSLSGGGGGLFGTLAAGLGRAGASAGGAAAGMGGLLGAALKVVPVLGQIGFAVTGLTALFQGLSAAISGMLQPLQALAAEAGRFNKQVAEGGIFAANSFSILGPDGKVVAGTANQMRAVRGAITAEYKKIQQEVSQISGATADEIYEGFNIILQNVDALGKQGEDLGNVSKLATRIAAGMNTLGVPGYQLRSEVNALMQGNIGPDSMLAKKLGYESSGDIQRLQSQGKFYDDLITKLNKLYDGQKVLALSLSNVQSNFEDVFKTIASQSGQALESGLARGLQGVLTTLDALKGSFIGAFRSIAELMEPLLIAFGQLGSMIVSLGSIAASVISVFGDLVAVITALAGAGVIPLLQNLAKNFEVLAQLIGLAAKAFSTALRPVTAVLNVLSGGNIDNVNKGFEDFQKNIQEISDWLDRAAISWAEPWIKMADAIVWARGKLRGLSDEAIKAEQANTRAAVLQRLGGSDAVSLKPLRYQAATEELLRTLQGTGQSERNVYLAKQAAEIRTTAAKNEIQAQQQVLSVMEKQLAIDRARAEVAEARRGLVASQAAFAVQTAQSPEAKLQLTERRNDLALDQEKERIEERKQLLLGEREVMKAQMEIQIKQAQIQQESLKIQKLELQIARDKASLAQQDAYQKWRNAAGTPDEAKMRANMMMIAREVDARNQMLRLMDRSVSLAFENEGALRSTLGLEEQRFDLQGQLLGLQGQSAEQRRQQEQSDEKRQRQEQQIKDSLEDRVLAQTKIKNELDAELKALQQAAKVGEERLRIDKARSDLLLARAKEEVAVAEQGLQIAKQRDDALATGNLRQLLEARIAAGARGEDPNKAAASAAQEVLNLRRRQLILEQEQQRRAVQIQKDREDSERRIAAIQLRIQLVQLAIQKAQLEAERQRLGLQGSADNAARVAGGLPPTTSGTGMASPSAGRPAMGGLASQQFGAPRDGYSHQGVDIEVDPGSAVASIQAGKVVKIIDRFGKVGKAVVVQNADGTQNTYGHVTPSVGVGDSVQAGTRIGTIASVPGNSHLHLERRDSSGRLLDPTAYARQALAGGSPSMTPSAPAAAAPRIDKALQNADRFLNFLASLESSFKRDAENPVTKAAGRFQFLDSTVQDAKDRLGMTKEQMDMIVGGADFGKQKELVMEYIKRLNREAYDAIRSGKFDVAKTLLRGTWPSLPGGDQSSEAKFKEAAPYLLGKAPPVAGTIPGVSSVGETSPGTAESLDNQIEANTASLKDVEANLKALREVLAELVGPAAGRADEYYGETFKGMDEQAAREQKALEQQAIIEQTQREVLESPRGRFGMRVATAAGQGLSQAVQGTADALVSGGDVKQVLSQVMGQLGRELMSASIDALMQPLISSLQETLFRGISGFDPAAIAQQAAATTQQSAATTQAMSSGMFASAVQAFTLAAGMGGGANGLNLGGLASGLGGLGSLFGGGGGSAVASTASAFTDAFNPAGMLFNLPLMKFASGGVATGPTSGYLAMLHGTEAVVPLGSRVGGPEAVRDALAGDSNPFGALEEAIGVPGEEPGVPEINYSGATLLFDSTDYVAKKDVPKIVKASVAATGREMRNSVAFRERTGMRH